jgi:hypothetical protein
MVADDDAVDVAAEHRAIPDAAVRAERHIADDGGGLGDENIFAKPQRPAEKFVELWREFVHAQNLAAVEIESNCRAKKAKAAKAKIFNPFAAFAFFARRI